MTHSALLEFWEPTRLTSLSAARNRVQFIQRLRKVMLGISICCVILLLGSAIQRGMDREAQRPREFEAEDIVRMVNPRFSGRNAKGEPYQVLAATAMRRKREPNIIDLVTPIMKDAHGGSLSSATGIYNTETKTIELTGKVNFNDKSGYKMDTSKTIILLAEDRVVGRAGVSGQGPFGDIQANSYEVEKAGQSVVFSGGVRTRLKERAPSTAPEAPTIKGRTVQ
ncbi:MAG: LPS export ABC transporter periplasmic protein LptC [Caulobacterales bacterium]